MRETNCKFCGREVLWRESRAGKTYLAEPAPIYNEDGRHIKTIYPSHQCRATEQERLEVLRLEQERAKAQIDAGEIVKGQQVVVVKGRKFPIGTRGVIVWVANEPDQFDVVKAKVLREDGEAFYCNTANLKAEHLVE